MADWKSLTDGEWVNIVNSDAVKAEGSYVHGAVCAAFKLIEARLREKNEVASPPVAVQEEGDAKRFDWFFGPADKIGFMPTYMQGMRQGWTVQEWRSAIDAAMHIAKGDQP